MTYNATKYAPVSANYKGDKGDTGTPGSLSRHTSWAAGHVYAANDTVPHAKTGYGDCTYICILGHTAAAGAGGNEPEVATAWATYWSYFAEGGADGAGSGDVTGDTASTTGNLAGFADTSGKAIEDIGTPTTVVTAVLNAISATTTTPDGDVDYILTKESGGWKLKLADNFAKKEISFVIPAQAIRPFTTGACGAPSPTEMPTYKFPQTSCAFDFAAGTKTYGAFEFIMPDGYDGGNLGAKIAWHTVGTSVNTVHWCIAFASIGDNETLDPALGTAGEVSDTATGTARKNLMTSKITAITPSGTPAAGELVQAVVWRDPGHGDDNLDEIVYLNQIKLYIPVNKHSEA